LFNGHLALQNCKAPVLGRQPGIDH
jgi:hypothetical protein